MIEILKHKSHAIKYQAASTNAHDKKYTDFVNAKGAGYYFSNSLHIYGKQTENKWDDIDHINTVLKETFESFEVNALSFGQDVFGNQFIFSNNGVYFFNIESSETEYIAKNFSGWLNAIYEEENYFSGSEFSEMLEVNKQEDLAKGFRLSPKYPFLLGGNYEISNLYLKNYNENLIFNGYLSSKIKNIPDGQSIKINIEHK